MEISLNVVDRVYESIVQWCEQRNVTVEDYCVKLIEDGFYTEKYGDLNDMLSKRDEKTNLNITEKKKSSDKKNETVKTVVETVKKEETQPIVDKNKDVDTVRKIKRTIKAK